MSSHCRVEWLGVAAALALAGCSREARDFKIAPAATSPPTRVAMTNLVGGESDPAYRAQQERAYQDNAYQVSQGQELYSAFNCVGCHAHGGGDVGPALMDDKWIYGGEIDEIYLSVAQGRPNGMPAFAGRIPPEQIWQIAAYVRSLGGNAPKSVQAERSDHMQTAPPSDKPTPVRSNAGDEGAK
jgi:cytochrome c oxidase cbb3-type subunit 3